MRRNLTAFRLLVPVLGLGLVLAGCGGSGDTGTKRTVTVLETYTSGADGGGAGSGSAQSGSGTADSSGVTVVVPSGDAGASGSGTAGSGEPSGAGQPSGSGDATASGATGSEAAGSEPAESSAKATGSSAEATASAETSKSAETNESAADLKDVDPLTISCLPIITQHDIKVATGVTVVNKSKRIKDVANKKVSSSGSIRCLYGLEGSDHKLSLRVTQYTNAAAAEKQSAVTVEAEESLGAKISEAEVNGMPATVMIRDGGLISLQYGDWTLSIAAVNGWMKKDVPGQLTELAEVALKRILQTAD